MQVLLFHSSCNSYMDSIPATARVRFLSLLAKLDAQSKVSPTSPEMVKNAATKSILLSDIL